MLVRGSNHCCCKPPKQCEVEIPLNEYSRFSFDAKEKEDENFGVSFDNGTSSVELTGQGSYTVRVTDNPKSIFVRTHILELNAGAGGITIRRPDSDQSISLWWLGGTSYELRHGTTVLESITHTAASQDLKLELATPRDATTDVLVYIDAALVHTEVGVAFVMPDVLHLGMVVEGPTPMGGEIRFGFFEVSPCLASTCEPYDQFCYADPWTAQTLTVPKMWHVNIPWPSDLDSGWPDPLTYCMDPNGPGFDVLYPQDIYFKLGTDVVYYDAWNDGWSAVDGCGHAAFTPSKVTYYQQYNDLINETPYSLPPVPEGKFPYEYAGFCDDGTLANPRPVTIFPHSNDKHGDDFTHYTEGSWILAVEFRNIGTPELPDVEYRIRVGFYDSGTIEYVSDWMPHTGEVIDSSITLNINTNTSMYTGWNSSVYLQPNGGSTEFALRAMGCGRETCTPPLTPQPMLEYFIWLTFEDEDGDFWDYPVCLGIDYNDTTGSWEWVGVSDGGDTHPTCGTLPFIEVKIHCVEPDEGESKQWVMDITSSLGTARLLQVEDPEMGNIFEGTSGFMCSGQTWSAATLPLNTIEDSSPQFGDCDQSSCGFLWLRGQATIGCNDFSSSQANFYLNRSPKGNSGSPPSEWTIPGVDPSSIYGPDVYTGTWPFGSGYTLYVWAVDGSTYAWKVSHSSGTNIAMSSGSITCVGGEFGLDYTSSPYDWFGLPGGDPFGVCPGLDDSANIDIVWG